MACARFEHETIQGEPREVDDEGLPSVLAGRYQILDRIGEGGMGVVCRGFDLDLEETVAIKLLRGDLADDDDLRARFRREVKLARRVTHPNVARVFEFGRDGHRCFLTMEYVPGESLQHLLAREAPLPPARLLALVTDLCEGLAAAHAAGVVHGDIKPGNILVAPGRGAVLTDFGIAQALSDTMHAIASDPSGTPLYMAPEQARGEPMSPCTDVYAVGVLLYEALTGESPWDGLVLEGDALGLLACKRRGDEPDLQRGGAELAPEWARLVADCLRTDPARRPQDAHALLARLAALRGDAGPTAPMSEALAPLAAGEGPRWVEVGPFTGPDAETFAWVRADLVDALRQVRGLRVLSRAVGPEGRPGPRVVARVSGELLPRPESVGVAIRVHDGAGAEVASFELHLPRRELHLLGVELAARVAAAVDRPPGPPPQRDTLAAEVSELYVQARHAYLTMHLDRALQLFGEALARSPDNRLLRLGHTLARVQAAFMFREASPKEIAELNAAVDEAVLHHGELGESHLARARVSLALGDPAGCARSLCAAIVRAPSLVEGYTLLADLLVDIGRLPDAERRLDIALALDRSSAFAWTCRARLLAYQGRWPELHALIDGPLTQLRFRSIAVARLLLWRPDRAVLGRLEAALVDNTDDLPTPMWRAARELVAFALERGDRREIIGRVEEFYGTSTHARRNCFVAQILCEMWCVVGDLERAREALAVADRHALSDWQWLEHCPPLAPLRGPALAELRARVRARADAIADAIWG